MAEDPNPTDEDELVSPQPLSKIPGGSSNLRIGAEHVTAVNPELAALAMQMIATCSYMDLGLTQIAAFLSGGKYTVTASMLHALTGARQNAIDAIARAALEESSPREYRWYCKVMKRVKRVRDRRNMYAHYLWAISPSRPDLLVLIQDIDVALVEASTAAQFADNIAKGKRLSQATPEAAEEIRKEQIVPRRWLDLDTVLAFSKQDLESDVARARTAADYVTFLKWSFGNDDRIHKIVRPELDRIFPEAEVDS
jgi:hypothetical protein